MMRRALILFAWVAFVVASLPAASADQQQLDETARKAIAFLKSKGQVADGSFSSVPGPAVTALVATAMLENGVPPTDPSVAKALAYVESFKQSDGGVYEPKSNWKNYETCLAILCFTAANQDGRYAEAIKKADAYIKGLQWDEGEDKPRSDFYHGGAGYGGSSRPDLSNTSFLLDALKAAGNGPEDEAVKKALLFVSRCQNLESEHNTTPFAAINPDGGFYYTPAAGGVSQAGKTEAGGLRSYASMTYAGLKSMIYAGLDKDDQRVKAAVTWLAKNYDLESNPGLGDAGLYYYYHTFAKALEAFGEDEFLDEKGARHDWRAELIAELASRQREDGSWVNENSRWMEGDANLVTGYALLALAHCRK
jgi:squalene-hopene/tetraprenyl-beta-curcumene cyclase